MSFALSECSCNRSGRGMRGWSGVAGTFAECAAGSVRIDCGVSSGRFPRLSGKPASRNAEPCAPGGGFETGRTERSVTGRGGTERGVSPVAKFRRVRRRIVLAPLRRCVWPVAEWRQAGQSKSRDYLKGESPWMFCSPATIAALETAGFSHPGYWRWRLAAEFHPVDLMPGYAHLDMARATCLKLVMRHLASLPTNEARC